VSEAFHLIDLVAQAGAVRKLLAGRTDAEKLAWLERHGQLEILPSEFPNTPQSYLFESVLGQNTVFFFKAGDFVIVGEHTTLTADDDRGR
jgi:hypothetical protein